MLCALDNLYERQFKIKKAGYYNRHRQECLLPLIDGHKKKNQNLTAPKVTRYLPKKGNIYGKSVAKLFLVLKKKNFSTQNYKQVSFLTVPAFNSILRT